MFYENERIIRKQQKHIRNMADSKIKDLENQGLSHEDKLAHIDELLVNPDTEIQVDILKCARKVLTSEQENRCG